MEENPERSKTALLRAQYPNHYLIVIWVPSIGLLICARCRGMEKQHSLDLPDAAGTCNVSDVRWCDNSHGLLIAFLDEIDKD